VTLDVIHLVFAAFGDVHKIATFEKAAGFQALVQYDDKATADQASQALNGRSIPRYLLPEECGSCTLRITTSGHTDLNVKFQSFRSRDYRNPLLPVSQVDPEGLSGAGGSAGGGAEMESNVLLATIDNDEYPVTVEVLKTVFSTYGMVQKIAMFEKGSGSKALIQYADVATATNAKAALEGHSIYDGGFNTLKLNYSRHTDLNVKLNNERGWDYTRPAHPPAMPPPGLPMPGMPVYHAGLPPPVVGFLGGPPPMEIPPNPYARPHAGTYRPPGPPPASAPIPGMPYAPPSRPPYSGPPGPPHVTAPPGPQSFPHGVPPPMGGVGSGPPPHMRMPPHYTGVPPVGAQPANGARGPPPLGGPPPPGPPPGAGRGAPPPGFPPGVGRGAPPPGLPPGAGRGAPPPGPPPVGVSGNI